MFFFYKKGNLSLIMNQFVELENTIKKLYDTLEKFYPENKEIDFGKYLNNIELLRSLNEHQDSISILLDVRKYEVINLSGDCYHFFGYSTEEIREDKLQSVFKLLDKQNLNFPINSITWYLNTLKKVPHNYKRKHFGSLWGVCMQHKNGRNLKCLFSFKPLEFDEENKPILMMVVISDVTHLLKGNNYWFRLTYGDNVEKRSLVYQSTEHTTIEQDILTEREKEILRYIADGNDTKHIAASLSISPNTVDNHRRNMLSRTGTRDTTALIQLCKMMNVL